MKTAELTGALLDYWVARAEGYEWASDVASASARGVPAYSTDWAHGGPIIERENIHLSPPTSRVHRHGGPNAGWGASGVWSACTWHKGANGRRSIAHHETSALVAAMCCYVVSKFGDEVSDTPQVAATGMEGMEG